jgi:hypothetical protein
MIFVYIIFFIYINSSSSIDNSNLNDNYIIDYSINNGFSSYGNELEQFYRYVSLTKAIDIEKLASNNGNLNESFIYELYRQCERGTVPELGHRFYNCRHDIRKTLSEIIVPLWSHARDEHQDKKFQVDYTYSILKPSYEERKNLFLFDISQLTSISNYNLINGKGGSTFEIFAKTTEFLISCQVWDQFDNTYKASCILPSRDKSDSNLNLCLHINIILHFEHFDAFWDTGDEKFSSLHHQIFNGILCSDGIIKTDNVGQIPILPSNYNLIPGSRFWTNSHKKSKSIVNSNYDLITGQPESNTNLIYEWYSNSLKYKTVSSMKKCLREQTLYFVGESHMRYQFDITMDRYVDKLKVGRYHGNMNSSGISYRDMTFSTRMAEFIDTIQCNSIDKGITYVLQTGSWDLQFFAPRGFITSPYQGKAVISSLKRLLERITNGNCKSRVRIIWISTMPHPYCKSNEDHCARLMNYWRNNGAVRACNQFMEKEINQIGFDRNNLIIIDAPSIILPRFQSQEFVCTDHFMCNDPPRGLVTTPAGMALANEVLNTACSMTSSNYKKYDNSDYKLDNNKYPDIVDNFKNMTNFSDNHYYLGKNSKKLFTILDGCKRLVPDVTTKLSMGITNDKIEEVDDYIIDDIPLCWRLSYPSRSTYTLLQTFSSKRVYFMDNGKKRQLKGAGVLYEFNLDFDNVTLIIEEDLEAIPNGNPIGAKSECESCF